MKEQKIYTFLSELSKFLSEQDLKLVSQSYGFIAKVTGGNPELGIELLRQEPDKFGTFAASHFESKFKNVDLTHISLGIVTVFGSGLITAQGVSPLLAAILCSSALVVLFYGWRWARNSLNSCIELSKDWQKYLKPVHVTDQHAFESFIDSFVVKSKFMNDMKTKGSLDLRDCLALAHLQRLAASLEEVS